MSRLQPLFDWLRRVVTSPREELTRWQRTVRFGYDLGRYGARQLRRDQAPRMAAALSFRTLFGLLPLLVVGTILVKAFGGLEQFRPALGDFLSSLGWDRLTVSDVDVHTPMVAAGSSLSELVLELFGQVQRLNLAAIGWVGVAVLVYSVTSLMVTVEGCFNGICRAPEGRPWSRRVPIYWTLVTLAPAAIALTVYVDDRFHAFLAGNVSWWWVLNIAPILWSYTATWLVMTVVYRLMPATNVQTRPALVGAMVAALLLEIGKRTLGAYLENALSISHLYGSLGLIPLFMFWVYLMWLVVLFGLEVTATVQLLSSHSFAEIERRRQSSGLVDPAAILAVVGVVATRFETGQPTDAGVIADETGLGEGTVEIMLAGLVDAGIVHRLDRDDRAVTLSRPPDTIAAGRLIEIGFDLVDEGGLGRIPAVLTRLREAQRALAERLTLTELLRPQPVVSKGDQVAGGG